MASEKANKQTPRDEHGTGPVDVLLVEDSPTDAQLLRESLLDYPLQQFVVEHAERLEEAAGLLAQRTFDVILLDLDLPDSRGMQTAERLSRAAAEVPIIILTGADDERMAADAMCLGVQDYMVKEYSRGHAIGRAVRYAVERHRAQQALQKANEQLQAQTEELARQRELLQAIIDNIPVFVVLWDGQLRQSQFNEEFRRVLGWTEADVASGDFMGRVYPDPDYRREVEEYMRSLQPGWRDLKTTAKDGRIVDVSWANVRLPGDRSIGIGIDIHERKRMEGALRELTATLDARVAQRTAELKHRARQLQQLTLEMSEAEERERKRLAEILHDGLQQQLAAAKFHLGLLSTRLRGDAPLQEAAVEVTGMLKDAIEKTRSLSHELSPALLYQGDFGAALEWLANQSQARHGLVVHVETRGPVEIASDPIRAFLFRTAQEILFNIVKHARVAEARVRLQRRRGRLWLTVSDKGRGFDPHALGQAAGFGLLSIRERVELLDGRMKIRSVPGRGSTFLIAVPDDATLPQGGAAGAGVAAPYKASERLRVLLADDHEVVREGLALLLNEQEDIEVVGQAANGREAVDLAHQLQPDVVVMDVAMPLMEGDEATRQIKQDMPRTRIVGLSMFEEPDTAEKMHEAGAERYMLKTAPAEELLAAIREK